MYKYYSILPCGKVNIKTGKFKYGDFYGFWGDDTCYEVYQIPGKKIRVVATAGTKPLNDIHHRRWFIHNQTRRHLFDGIMIDYVVGDEGFRSLLRPYGNNLNVYTYK